MEIVPIRHGQPDYTPCDERGFIGHGRSLAPLSPLGVSQAEAAGEHPALEGVELMVASPLTRAMQTAAIISRKSGIPLTVEVDLREWEPDLTYQFGSSEECFALSRDFWACKGEFPAGETRRWETISSIIKRIDPLFSRYMEQGFQKIAVVAHGGVIRRLTGDAEVICCQPYSVEYNGDYPYFGWVE